MAQEQSPSREAMEVAIRQRLTDVFGSYDTFAHRLSDTHSTRNGAMFGVVPTSLIMKGLTPYTRSRIVDSSPSASHCLQEMRNVPPLLPPLQLKRDESRIENENVNEHNGCTSEASSSNSNINDDDNNENRKGHKRRRSDRKDEDEGPIKRKEDETLQRNGREDRNQNNKSNVHLGDLFDDDDDDSEEGSNDNRRRWRERNNSNTQSNSDIRRIVMNMQVPSLIPPVDDLMKKLKDYEDEEKKRLEEDDERLKKRRKEKEKEENERKRRIEDEEKKRKDEEKRKKEEDDRRKRKEDEERRKREDDERKKRKEEEERKRKEDEDERKKKDDDDRRREKEEEDKKAEETQRLLRKEKKRREKERIRKEEEDKKRKEKDEDDRRKEKEEKERIEEKRREIERIRIEEEKKKELERLKIIEDEERRKEEEINRKKAEEEKKRIEDEERIRKEKKKKEEEKNKLREIERNEKKKRDNDMNKKDEKRKDKEKTKIGVEKGSLHLSVLSPAKLELLKEKEKERKKKEKEYSSGSIQRNDMIKKKEKDIDNCDKKKKLGEKDKESKEERRKDKDGSSKLSNKYSPSPLSSKNSSRVATPIPPLQSSTQSSSSNVIPPLNIFYSFPNCPSSSCVVTQFAPLCPPPLLDQKEYSLDDYTLLAKKKKHIGDAELDKVMKFIYYMESTMLFALSVSHVDSMKSSEKEILQAGMIMKETTQLIKSAIFLLEKDPYSSHLFTRAKILCLRVQAVFSFHMYSIKAIKGSRRHQANLETQIQESNKSSPMKSEVTMPMSLWKMKSSQVNTLEKLENAFGLWDESSKLMNEGEKLYYMRIDQVITHAFEWGSPLHFGSSLIHLAYFINTVITWMKEEYITEQRNTQ